MLTLLRRFITIWQPTFLRDFVRETNVTSASWGFWFVSNTLIAALGTIVITAFVVPMMHVFLTTTLPREMPAFEATIEKGKLSTTLPEPYEKSFTFGEKKNEIFPIVIDTQRVKYDEEKLATAAAGVYVFDDRVVMREMNGKMETHLFSEFGNETVHVTKADIEQLLTRVAPMLAGIVTVVVAIGLWLWLAVFRLISAVMWALILFVAGRVFLSEKIRFDFGTSYLAVLHFAFIPLVIGGALFIVGIHIPFATAIIFIALFGVNIWHIKNDVSAKPTTTKRTRVVAKKAVVTRKAVKKPTTKK